MPPVAFCDANVLYPSLLRDLLIRLDIEGVCRLRWSDEVQEEWIRALVRDRGLPREPLERTRALMERALPQARVDGYQGLVLTLTLPDPDDRHVLAAAMHSGAPHLLTFNLDDFPASALPVGAPQAVHPDHWLAPVLADHPAGALQALEKVVAGLKNPPMNIHEMTEHLVRLRLPTTATVLRGLTNML